MARKIVSDADPVKTTTTPPPERTLADVQAVVEGKAPVPERTPAEIAAALDVKTEPAAAAAPAAAPTPPKYKDIEEFYAADPEGAQAHMKAWYDKLDPVEKSVVDRYNAVQANYQRLNEDFAELQPLVEYALERGPDGKLKNLDTIKRLNDPAYRAYALEDAARVWDATKAPGDPAAGEPGSAATAHARGADPAIVQRLDTIEKTISTRDMQTRVQTHDQYRAQEVQALALEVPGLKYWNDAGEIVNQKAYERMKMIADYARTKSFNPDGSYNYERPFSIKKAYEQFKVWEADRASAPDLPAIASTSQPGPPAARKPKDPAKRKQAAIDKIDSLGGFAKVAAALDKGR